MMKILAFFIAALALASGQVIMSGQCDRSIPVVDNFDVERYMGVWFETFRYEQIFQLGGECVTATYTLNENNVTVFNRMVANNTEETILGTARVDESANGGGKLFVNFPSVGRESPYWVLTTNYNDYALVYSCGNIGSSRKAVSSWILSRNSTLSQQGQAVADEVIKRTDDLIWQNYVETDQSEQACEIRRKK